MDNPENSLIVASRRDLPTFALNTPAKEAISKALQSAALIGKVTDRDSKLIAVRAQQDLKGVIKSLEDARVVLTEPLLNAQRSLKRMVDGEKLALEKEFGRVSNVVKDFDDGERRRIAEEERLQREELARIEREKQAELKRIADEQAEAERKIQAERERVDKLEREAREAAEKLVREAKNKSEREAAAIALALAKENEESNRKEEERMRAEAASKAAVEAAAVKEQFAAAAYVESRPIEMTRVDGQVTKTDWEITVLNPWELAKYHPDCVKIEPLLTPIKAALNEGRTVKGIRAEKITRAGVRVGKDRNLIEV